MARKLRKPNERQLKYLAGRAAGLSPEKAVIEAGYRGAKPSRIVADLERREFNAAVHEAFTDEGIDLPFIAKTLKAEMEAEVVDAFCTRSGDVVYAEARPDHQARHKATVTAADLLGLSSRARMQSAEADKPKGDGVNILVLAQRFESYSDSELEEAMQLMRVGQFDGSALAGDVVVSEGAAKNPEPSAWKGLK